MLADAPALETLDLSRNTFDASCLAALMTALPRNRHLRKLNVCRLLFGAEFARDCLLPAVRANTGQRELACATYFVYPSSILREAEALVRARPPRS